MNSGVYCVAAAFSERRSYGLSRQALIKALPFPDVVSFFFFFFPLFRVSGVTGQPCGKGAGKVTWCSLSWERSLEEVKYSIQCHLETSSGGDFIASLGRFFSPLNDRCYCKNKLFQW